MKRTNSNVSFRIAMRIGLPQIALLIGLVLVATVSPASAMTLTFRTSDSRFDPDFDNQGWYDNTGFTTRPSDNYFTGSPFGGDLRSFFTFDLSSAAGIGTVIGARLDLRRFFDSANNEPTETLEFFDVSADAATLSNNTGTGVSVYNDLGTGTTYGAFVVPGSGASDDVLSFQLNAAALADLNAALGGFFSIGGTLTSQDTDVATSPDWLFGASDGTDPQELVLEFTPIPEPGTLLLLASGLAGIRFRIVFLRRAGQS